MSDVMKIIYMGDGKWAHKAFDQIQTHNNFIIEKVILRSDSSDKRLRKKAEQSNIEVLTPPNINDPDLIEQLSTCGAQLGVSMSYNQILKKGLIELFPEGIINCHAGKLPYYRGRNVLNWALINGEKEIGVTCHFIDKGVDTGDIIVQKTFPVTLGDDYGTVLKKSFNLCAEVLIEGIEKIYDGSVERRAQPKTGSYFINRKEGDEFIDWSWESEKVYNFVRGITTPGPCAQSWLQTGESYQRIFVKKINLIDNFPSYNCIPGAVIAKSEEGNSIIKTGDTAIELSDYEIEDEGKILKIGDRLGFNINLWFLNKFIK